MTMDIKPYNESDDSKQNYSFNDQPIIEVVELIDFTPNKVSSFTTAMSELMKSFEVEDVELRIHFFQKGCSEFLDEFRDLEYLFATIHLELKSQERQLSSWTKNKLTLLIMNIAILDIKMNEFQNEVHKECGKNAVYNASKKRQNASSKADLKTVIEDLIKLQDLQDFDFEDIDFFDREKVEKEIIKAKHLLDILPNSNPKSNKNYEEIFPNGGFVLFQKLLTDGHIVSGKGRQSDINYFYDRMLQDDYVYDNYPKFQKWYNKTFSGKYGNLNQKIALDQSKTVKRNKDYDNTLNWFKAQN